MGVFGLIALVVNVAAAWVLRQHKEGDANVRAVWLFSRNDAIANVAVVIAAGFVWLTATPWPDLIVAAVIAALFLHSAWEIIGDARRDLTEEFDRLRQVEAPARPGPLGLSDAGKFKPGG